jgi:dTDP-L-rhamnose 4-epimerase
VTGETVLVTGGAGFVGSHLVDALLERGATVRILDNLDAQVHPGGKAPEWISDDAELRVGDVRDPTALASALQGVDVVYHLAAAVGVGQSMYRIADYTETNTAATARLLQVLVDERMELRRLVVASSMSIYGEGLYTRSDGGSAERVRRAPERLARRLWEPVDTDGAPLEPSPTPEEKQLDPTSVYALTKADQERLTLLTASAYAMPAVALRFFNIFGPRQALSNPYTGVMAIFSSRLLNGKSPLIFEDGAQRRDFVSVHDVVRALLLAAERDEAVGHAFNVGSGRALTVRQVAEGLAQVLDVPIEPELTGQYRVGDVRHCTADITKAARCLGYEPEVSVEQGLGELVEWLARQERPHDGIEQHAAELAGHGLTV